MDIRKIDDNFSVSPQITPDAVSEIAAAGYQSIICNRPDTEDGAVPHDEVEAAARKAGLAFSFLPVVSGAFTEEDVRNMKELVDTLPKPILAYCRSGGRCTNIYGLAQSLQG